MITMSYEGVALLMLVVFIATFLIAAVLFSSTDDTINKRIEASGVWRFKSNAYKLVRIQPNAAP